MTFKLQNVQAVTDCDLLDDVTADGVSVAAMREQKAREAKEAQAAHKGELRERQKSINDLKAQQTSPRAPTTTAATG